MSCSTQCLAHSEGLERILVTTHYPCMHSRLPSTPCEAKEQHSASRVERSFSYRTLGTLPPLNESVCCPRPRCSPSPAEERLRWRVGRRAGKAGEPAARGPRPPRSPWDPGQRPRLALAPRGSWARHAHAADTATRAGRGGGTESLRAPVRPPAAVEGGARLARAPLGLPLLLTTGAARPGPWAAQPRPYPGVPARLSGRGTSFAPQIGGRKKTLTQLRPHTRAPSPVYITATQPNLLRPGPAGW